MGQTLLINCAWRTGLETSPEIIVVGEIRVKSWRHIGGFVLDEEIVVLYDRGRPSFERVQQWVQAEDPAQIARLSLTTPVICWAFELLAVADYDRLTVAIMQ